MTTDDEVIAAVRAYRQVRLDAGHLNVHVHAQGMRAALDAAEKVRTDRMIEQNTKAFEEFAAPVAPISDLTRNLLHNHSTTDMATLGLRPPGQCRACDHERGDHR